MEIIGIQFDPAWESPSSNRQSVIRLLEGADIRRPALILRRYVSKVPGAGLVESKE